MLAQAASSTVDALGGAMMLGAYGDALGGNFELLGMEGKTMAAADRTTTIAPFGKFYDAEQLAGYQQPWGIWVNATAAPGVAGMVTDDTSFRVWLLESWLNATRPSAAALRDQVALKTWMEKEEEALWAHETYDCDHVEPDGGQFQPYCINARRRGMLSDFLVMSDLAGIGTPKKRTRGENKFFEKGCPAAFGLYMFLEAAVAASAHMQPADAFKTFFNMTDLDLEYGGLVTGVMMTMAVQAGQADSKEAFGPWFLATMADTLKEIAASHGAGLPSLALVGSRYSLMTKLGSSVAGDDEALLAAWTRTYNDKTLTPQHKFRNSDPLLMLMEIGLFVAGTSTQPGHAVQLMAEAPGDSDTVASILGVVEGAYYGASRLEQAMPAVAAQVSGPLRRFMDAYYRIDWFTQASAMAGWVGAREK